MARRTLPSRLELKRQAGYSGRMRVTVLYFGVLKDWMGSARETVDLEAGANVAALVGVLRGGASGASNQRMDERVWERVAVAVNREYAGAGVSLADGDEVALLPPVSGGLDAD